MQLANTPVTVRYMELVVACHMCIVQVLGLCKILTLQAHHHNGQVLGQNRVLIETLDHPMEIQQ